jgi:thioredoxin reductase (NADPH)
MPADAVDGGHQPEEFWPVILAVDGEPEALERVEHELRKRYEADYRVVCEVSVEARLQRLRGLKAAGESGALVLADQQIPSTEGVEFLSRARQIQPTTRPLLLIDPMDRIAWEMVPRAMALGRIDYVEYKPGPPPNERFHEVATGLLREWTRPYARRQTRWFASSATGGLRAR